MEEVPKDVPFDAPIWRDVNQQNRYQTNNHIYYSIHRSELLIETLLTQLLLKPELMKDFEDLLLLVFDRLQKMVRFSEKNNPNNLSKWNTISTRTYCS